MKSNSALARFNRQKQLFVIMVALLFAIALIAAISIIATPHFAFGAVDTTPVLETNDVAAEADDVIADDTVDKAGDSMIAIQESKDEATAPDTKADAPSKEPAKIEYKVRHFKVNEDGGIELVETEELEGLEDDSVTITPKEIAGYKFEENFDDGQGNTSKTTGTLSRDEELVLNAYYVMDDAEATADADEEADDKTELSNAAATGKGVDDVIATANAALRSVGNALFAAKALSAQAVSSASGSWGECAWELDDSGTLTVYGGTGAGSLSDALGGNSAKVKRIVFEGDVKAPANCGALFYGMSSLEAIDMSGLDMSGAEKADAMFYGCSSLKSVSMSGMTLPAIADMRAFFYGCAALENVNLSKLIVSAASNMSAMFYGCTSLKSVDMSGLVAKNAKDMGGMFYGCSTLESVDMSNLNAPLLEDMRSFFYGCSSLVKAALSGLNVPSVTNMSAMFSGCESLKSVDMSGVNAPKVQDLGALFYNCSSLTSVDLSGFNTPSLTNTGAMFSGCESLPSVDVSSLNTSNVTTMLAMFDRCSSLKSLDLSTFDTSSATNMGGMFAECSSLTALDLTSFNTSNVYSMMGMFDGCTSLRALDISSFDTSSISEVGGSVDDLKKMMSTDFSKLGSKVISIGLSALGLPDETIEVPYFDKTIVSNVGGTINMFGRCSSLEYVVVGSKTNPLGMLPAYPINGHTNWYSTKDQRWYTNMEIVQNRLGIADTYTKYGPSPIVVNSFQRPQFNSGASLARTGDDDGPIAMMALFGAVVSALCVFALLVGPVRRRA